MSAIYLRRRHQSMISMLLTQVFGTNFVIDEGSSFAWESEWSEGMSGQLHAAFHKKALGEVGSFGRLRAKPKTHCEKQLGHGTRDSRRGDIWISAGSFLGEALGEAGALRRSLILAWML